MKKALLTIAIAAFAFAANAQFVIGGNVGVQHQGNHDDDYTIGSQATTSVTLTPKVGYQLNDKMQVGAQLGWTYNYTRTYAGADDTYSSHPQSTIAIAPYFRYNVTKLKNFTLFCEAQVGLRFGLESTTHVFVDGDEKSTIDQNDNYTGFGLTVVPGLNYQFSDKLSMDIYVNLLGLYANKVSYDDYSTHSWGLVANMEAQDLNSHLNNFSIGFNYHF